MAQFLSYTTFCAIFLASLSAAAANPTKAFNESLNSEDELRAPYVQYQNKFGVQIYPVSDKTMNALLDKPLQDNIRILPIPLIISEADYKLLQAGAQQRFEALMAFFVDVVLNDSKKVLAANFFDKELIEHLFQLEGGPNLKLLREFWKGLSKEDIHTTYGPDIVRNADGNFVVLEDNVGSLGGIGDLAETHNIMGKALGVSQNHSAPLANAILNFLSDIKKEKWDEEVIAIVHSSDQSSIKPQDEEDERRNTILRNLGIKIITTAELNKDGDKLREVFDGKYKKIINFYEPFALGDTHLQRYMWTSMSQNKKTKLFFSPGISILSSKALLPFVDDFVRLYLGQEPILKTQQTEWVQPSWLNQMDDSWVVKKSDGSQGSEVYIIKDLTESGRKNLRRLLIEGMSLTEMKYGMALPLFVRQKLVDPSYLPATVPDSWIKFNIDYRPHTFVIGGKPILPAIWGRASWKIPGVLNNVNQGAMELVIKTPNGSCEDFLMTPSDLTKP